MAKKRMRRPDGSEPFSDASHRGGADNLRRVRDSYVNSMARLGMSDNLLSAGEYPLFRIGQNYNLMTSLYRNDWISGRIVDTMAEDMCKNWYDLKTKVGQDYINAYNRMERRSNVKSAILSGLKWARLYGGAAGLMMIHGQENILGEPLDADAIMPGDFCGIQIFDRWNGVVPSSELVEDPSDDEFGLPMYYDFLLGNGYVSQNAVRVHHSRVLRFMGRELPFTEKVAEQWWGMSELEHVYEELNKRNATSANIAQLMFQANLRVLKMDDFGELLSSASEDAKRDMYQVLSAQNQLMSNMGIQVLDKDDEYQNFQYTFSGVPEVYELFMLDVSGAAEIPATKLFGRAPQGMNATGESDLRNYYDTISQKQESALRPVLNKLVPVLCMSAWGSVPDDLGFDFVSVRDMTDKEKSDISYQQTLAIKEAFNVGIIDRASALRELKKIGTATGLFSTITEDDIHKAQSGEVSGFLPPEG